MRPDRKWMYQRWDGGYLNEEYISGVQEFLEFAKKEDSFINSAQLRCPCSKCKNLKYLDVESIRDHLYRKGFVKNYYEWVCHGEEFSDSVLLSNEGNPYRDMVIDVLGSTYDDTYDESEDIEEDPHPEAKKLFDMLKDAEKPLYEGCKMSMLEMAARIINLKSEYNLPHRCVDGFTSLMNDSFPDRNLMTRSFYDTRKVLEGLELPHEKIHACVNGCLLFWHENEHLDKCLKCGRGRYKMTSTGKMIPVKVLTYFPITPRLQRLYATDHIAKQMRWHAEHKRVDGVITHPSEGEAWMSLDNTYPDFDDGNGDLSMPKASYVLDKRQRAVLCEWIQELRFLDGYASNMSRCVDMRQMKLSGLKSHDCHVFMERLISVAFKELLPVNVWKAVTELSLFFRDICASTIKVDDMARLSKNFPEILCKLEKIFPPSFFNCMEHLPIHLPYEASVGGPVQYRWMYRFERKMYNLKQKIGNKARVEGSICNAYLTEEMSNFCTHYFESHVDTKIGDVGRNDDLYIHKPHNPHIPELFRVNMGRVTSRGKSRYLQSEEYKRAHLYVLSNCELLREYEREFEQQMHYEHSNVQMSNIWSSFEEQYPKWLENYRKEKGTMPSAADLFLRSHSKMEGSQRVLATDKARRTMVEYERLMSHYQSQGIEKHPDMVFYEAVGGHKKGQVYGLGESAPMYFEPSTFRSSRASGYDVHSMMSIDRQTFEEMQRSITHLTQRVEHLESQTQGGCHDFTPFSRDPRDPHNGATGSSASFTAAV